LFWVASRFCWILDSFTKWSENSTRRPLFFLGAVSWPRIQYTWKTCSYIVHARRWEVRCSNFCQLQLKTEPSQTGPNHVFCVSTNGAHYHQTFQMHQWSCKIPSSMESNESAVQKNNKIKTSENGAMHVIMQIGKKKISSNTSVMSKSSSFLSVSWNSSSCLLSLTLLILNANWWIVFSAWCSWS